MSKRITQKNIFSFDSTANFSTCGNPVTSTQETNFTSYSINPHYSCRCRRGLLGCRELREAVFKMSPSLNFLDSLFEENQKPQIKYLADVYCGYSAGDSECTTCPTVPACPKRAATKRHRRG